MGGAVGERESGQMGDSAHNGGGSGDSAPSSRACLPSGLCTHGYGVQYGGPPTPGAVFEWTGVLDRCRHATAGLLALWLLLVLVLGAAVGARGRYRLRFPAILALQARSRCLAMPFPDLKAVAMSPRVHSTNTYLIAWEVSATSYSDELASTDGHGHPPHSPMLTCKATNACTCTPTLTPLLRNSLQRAALWRIGEGSRGLLAVVDFA